MARVPKHTDADTAHALSQLGVLIRLHRQRRGLTQRDLAGKAGISQVRITRYETGAVDPPFSALHRIARALGVKVSDLLRHEAIEV